jgi:hypothetical protein
MQLQQVQKRDRHIRRPLNHAKINSAMFWCDQLISPA